SVLAFVITMVIAIPILLFPEFFLDPILNDAQMQVIGESHGILRIVLAILVFYILGTVIFQGMIGTGKVVLALTIQLITVVIYVLMLIIGVKYFGVGLEGAWAIEIAYWVVIYIVNVIYFKYYFNR